MGACYWPFFGQRQVFRFLSCFMSQAIVCLACCSRNLLRGPSLPTPWSHIHTIAVVSHASNRPDHDLGNYLGPCIRLLHPAAPHGFGRSLQTRVLVLGSVNELGPRNPVCRFGYLCLDCSAANTRVIIHAGRVRS